MTLRRKTGRRVDRDAALEILDRTAGLWRDAPEDGAEYVRRLRAAHAKRWARLNID